MSDEDTIPRLFRLFAHPELEMTILCREIPLDCLTKPRDVAVEEDELFVWMSLRHNLYLGEGSLHVKCTLPNSGHKGVFQCGRFDKQSSSHEKYTVRFSVRKNTHGLCELRVVELRSFFINSSGKYTAGIEYQSQGRKVIDERFKDAFRGRKHKRAEKIVQKDVAVELQQRHSASTTVVEISDIVTPPRKQHKFSTEEENSTSNPHQSTSEAEQKFMIHAAKTFAHTLSQSLNRPPGTFNVTITIEKI
jgi:hypothetical protein